MIRLAWMPSAVFGIGALATAPARSDQPDMQASFAGPKPTWDSVVRVARSDDGLTFTDTGQVLIAHAAAPDVALLPNGDLLALVDYAHVKDGAHSTTMAVSRSKDAGRSWSPLRPIRLAGRDKPVFNGDSDFAAVRGRHGDLVIMPDGTLRLYFADSGNRSRSRRSASSGGVTLIRSAVSRDGLTYRLDDRTRVTMRSGHRRGRSVHRGQVHPTAARIGSRVHLFGQSLEAGDSDHTQHLYSRDGKRFVRLTPVRTPEVKFVGSIVPAADGVRAYVSGEGGVRSLISKDGRGWVMEEGARMRNAWDPAVVRLDDGRFLMLYCCESEKESAASSQMVSVSPELQAAGRLADDAFDTGDGPEDDHAGGEGGGLGTADGADRVANGAEDIGPEGGSAPSPYVDEDGFVSVPDFRHKIDYFQWFCDELLPKPADNAYFAYDAFMPSPWDEPGSKPEWSTTLNDMFNGGEHDGPPGPWDPAEHPEWEATHEAVQGLLAQFHEASLHEGYAMPIDDEYKARIADPDGEVAMFNILLPSLSSHRAMVKAALADAWRLEDGGVSSERMLEAWRTSLRDAGHLNQGPTLIEELVSVAERAFVHNNARWALHEGVFAGEELKTALSALTEHDCGNRDPMIGIRGEYAFTMDTMQYLYWPGEPGGDPTFREDRARMFDFSDGTVAELRQLAAADVHAALDSFDAYYRELGSQMSIGYPDVRADDIAATHETHVQTNVLTDFLLPNLSRVHKLRARAEASRRATQLAYAIHLFKERAGRWPKSLDELANDYGHEMTIDPFTGDHFGYRLTDNGPTIYSLSENGRDDGGVHSFRWDDEIENDAGSDDHVFWPPQHRPRE